MREQTGAWLSPLMEEAGRRGIDTLAFIRQSAMLAAEADPAPSVDRAARLAGELPGARALAVDWIRLGQLLCHELGWDDTYPSHPDFPEIRDVP